MMKIAILGSTGSIGTQTLDIVREQGDIQVTAIAAGSNIKKLEEQMREFHPLLVCVFQEDAAKELRDRTKDLNVRVVSGMDGLLEVAVQPESEILVTAIVGMLGIRPTIAAIEAGKKIALANKETLVTAGHIIMPLAKKCGVPILPVDSEHSAIFQSLQGENGNRIAKILLTASGGPFRGWTREQMKSVQNWHTFRWRMRCVIRTGQWDARSRSIRQRLSIKAWKLWRQSGCLMWNWSRLRWLSIRRV